MFEKYGQIISLKIERNTAEVYYSNSQYATKASTNANGSVIGGSTIKVTYYDRSINGKI